MPPVSQTHILRPRDRAFPVTNVIRHHLCPALRRVLASNHLDKVAVRVCAAISSWSLVAPRRARSASDKAAGSLTHEVKVDAVIY